MKTIITQDKANRAFGYPQLDSNKKVSFENLPDNIVTTGENTFIGTQTITGLLNIEGVIENVVLNTETGSTINFDFNSGSIFYVSGSIGNSIYNIQNVPTSSNKALTTTFVIQQDVVPYSASGFQINDESIDVKWFDGTTPSGSQYKTEVIGLTSFRLNDSWNVLGSLTSFGTLPPALVLTFDDISNADTLVGDSSNLEDWNTFFDLPNYGNPFQDVKVSGNTIELRGGSNIETKFQLFSDNENLLKIYDNTGCIVTLGDETFGSTYGNSSLQEAHFPEVTETIGDPNNYGVFGQCYDLIYVYLPKCSVLGACTFYECEYLPSSGLTLPFDEITILNDYTFEYCYELTEINFPNVTDVGEFCFYDCDSVTIFDLPSLTGTSNSSFGYCNGVSSFDLPNLIIAGDYCFNYCTSVTGFSLPSLTTTLTGSFQNCTSVTGFSLPNLETAGDSCFNNCNSVTTFDLPSLTTAGDSCFYACSSVTGFSLPNLITAGNYCFDSCTSVTNFNLPNLTTAGQSCFSSCSSVTNFSLSNLTTAGDYCFNDCYSVTGFSLPNLTTASVSCFKNCTSVTTFDSPSLETAGDFCFIDCSSVTGFSLPSLTTAGENCFRFCSSLTTINLPSLTTTGDDCFVGLNLTSFDLPNLTTAGVNCFFNCSSVTGFSLPSLTTAGGGCFSNCTSMTGFSLSSLTTAGIHCFDGCNSVSNFDLPSLTTAGTDCFRDCYNVTGFSLPNIINLGGSVGDNDVFNGISGNNINLTIPSSLMTCNGGNPDGDIQYLQANNTVNITTV